METLFYLILGAVLYGIVADRTDRAVEREMDARRRRSTAGLHLVEEFDARPDLAFPHPATKPDLAESARFARFWMHLAGRTCRIVR